MEKRNAGTASQSAKGDREGDREGAHATGRGLVRGEEAAPDASAGRLRLSRCDLILTGESCKIGAKKRGCQTTQRPQRTRRRSFSKDPVTSAALISIVDDDEQVRKATENLIRSMGWEVLSFDCAVAYLASGAVGRTGLLISDVTMPSMSGIEMHAHLVAQGYAPPTIFVTAYPNPHDEAVVLANGALAYLEKPVESLVIMEKIQQIIGSP